MLDGGQEFVLIIIGMAMFAGVLKTSIRVKYGLADSRAGRAGRRARRDGIQGLPDSGSREVQTLKAENKRLNDQVETMQDRLIVLEKIVTDRGYTLADEIEALRGRREGREDKEKI